MFWRILDFLEKVYNSWLAKSIFCFLMWDLAWTTSQWLVTTPLSLIMVILTITGIIILIATGFIWLKEAAPKFQQFRTYFKF